MGPEDRALTSRREVHGSWTQKGGEDAYRTTPARWPGSGRSTGKGSQAWSLCPLARALAEPPSGPSRSATSGTPMMAEHGADMARSHRRSRHRRH